MELLCEQRIKILKEKLTALSNSRVLTNPMNFIDDRKMALGMTEDKLITRMNTLLERKKSSLVSHAAKLDALNPLSVVARGYSAVFNDEGKLIKSISQTKKGDMVSFMVTDGKISAEVICAEKNERKE